MKQLYQENFGKISTSNKTYKHTKCSTPNCQEPVKQIAYFSGELMKNKKHKQIEITLCKKCHEELPKYNELKKEKKPHW